MNAMANIELPYVQRYRDRHGRWRCYYRRAGFPRITLPDVGEEGFLAAYEAAVTGIKPREGVGGERTVPGSLGALIVAYYRSADFQRLRPSTQKGHRGLIESFRAKHGAKRVLMVEKRHLDGIFEEMAATPAQASNLRKRLRVLFDLAVEMGWRADNPVRATKRIRYKTKGFTPWSEADIAAYEERWPSGTRERLALALLLYTGQRRSDVVTMGRQHIKGGRIAVTQIKTGRRLAIPIAPQLKAEIDAAPKGLNFMLTAYGVPFSAAGFTAWFVAKAGEAGLEGRTPHGLRKAAGRRLAEAGCSAHEIMSILGHTSLAEAERYTKDVDQSRLADAAMKRLRGEA